MLSTRWIALSWILVSGLGCKEKEEPSAYYEESGPLWSPPAWESCNDPCQALSWGAEIQKATWLDESGKAKGPVEELPAGKRCEVLVQHRPGSSYTGNRVRIVCGTGVLFMNLSEDLSTDAPHEEIEAPCRFSGANGEPVPGGAMECSTRGPSVASHILRLNSKEGTATVTRHWGARFEATLKLGDPPSALRAKPGPSSTPSATP